MDNGKYDVLDNKSNELKPCPFCGGEAVTEYIGNDYTKSRKLKIKCSGCRIQITNAAIKHNFEWLEEVTFKAWNTRSPTTEEIETAFYKAAEKIMEGEDNVKI